MLIDVRVSPRFVFCVQMSTTNQKEEPKKDEIKPKEEPKPKEKPKKQEESDYEMCRCHNFMKRKWERQCRMCDRNDHIYAFGYDQNGNYPDD